jgi:uncharacterized protein YqgC (DUF456 family)
MTEIAEGIAVNFDWGFLVLVLMAAAALVSFVPFIPGPALVWAIGILYAIATEFQVVGLGTVGWMTLLMILGSTADWWTRLFGLKAEGSLSCGSIIVSTVGAILGTIFIPIPVLGTIIGAAGAVMAMVWLQEDDVDKAWTAARGILSAWVASFFVELLVCIIIVFMFARAVFANVGLGL